MGDSFERPLRGPVSSSFDRRGVIDVRGAGRFTIGGSRIASRKELQPELRMHVADYSKIGPLSLTGQDISFPSKCQKFQPNEAAMRSE